MASADTPQASGHGTAVARTYDEATITQALMVMALEGGSPTKAARRLKEQGMTIPRQTLSKWLTTKSDQYADVRDNEAASIQRRAAVDWEDFHRQVLDVEKETLERVKKELPNIPARDLPGALRNVVTSGGIAADKLMLLRERPLPRPAPSRSVEELVRGLISLGVAKVDEPATITDAEVIEQPSEDERT